MGHKINHCDRTEHMKTTVRAAVEVMFQRRASVSHSGSTVDISRLHFLPRTRCRVVGRFSVSVTGNVSRRCILEADDRTLDFVPTCWAGGI